MAKKLYQYRYSNDGDNKNRPLFIEPNDSKGIKGELPINAVGLINGAIFSNRMPIVQLGVQAPPGTKFYLNHGMDPVIVGTTGIFELDLQDGAQITAMRFDKKSVENIIRTETAMLMIDILYEEG